MCGVTGEERDEILDLCRTRHDSGVLRIADGSQHDALLYYAGQANLLVEYQPLIIPLLAQTKPYRRLRCPISLPQSWIAPAEEDAAAIHEASTDLLNTLGRVELLVHEWALRAPVDPEACRNQMQALHDLSKRPKVSLRVIPEWRQLPPRALSGFTALDEPERPTLVYRDEPYSGVFFDDPDQVAAHLEVLKDLQQIDLIEEIRDEPAPEGHQPEPDDDLHGSISV
jgi:hypothetical protein